MRDGLLRNTTCSGTIASAIATPHLSYSAVPFLVWLSQSVTSFSETEPENRCPVSHVPVPAIFWSVDALSSMPELVEVQKGMIVLPVKSLDLTKSFTGQAGAIHKQRNLALLAHRVNRRELGLGVQRAVLGR